MRFLLIVLWLLAGFAWAETPGPVQPIGQSTGGLTYPPIAPATGGTGPTVTMTGFFDGFANTGATSQFTINIGTAAANRYLLIGLSPNNLSVNSPAWVGVSINGTTLTQACQQNDISLFWGGPFPAGTTATLSYTIQASEPNVGEVTWATTGLTTLGTSSSIFSSGDPNTISANVGTNGTGIEFVKLDGITTVNNIVWTNTTIASGDVAYNHGQNLSSVFGAHTFAVGSPTTVTMSGMGASTFTYGCMQVLGP